MKRVFVIIVLAMVLLNFPASAQGTSHIQRSVIANGGGIGRLSGAIGQPVAGTVSDHGSLCSGFWCGFRTPSGTGLVPPSGTTVRLAYRFTFGQIGIGLMAMTLICLVAIRRLYDVTLNLWGTDERTNLSPMADRTPSDRGGSFLFRRPVRLVAGQDRDRRKSG